MSFLFGRRQVEERVRWREEPPARATVGRSWAGVNVTPEVALQVPAVAAGVHFVAGTISTLKLCGYREDQDYREVERREMPRLWREPSADLSPEDWFYRHIQAQMLDGTAWGRIVARDARFSPTQVELVPAEVVQVRKDRSSGELTFRFDGQDVDAFDVWRVNGRPSRQTIFGMSLAEKMSESIGVQLAARQYGAAWFRDGAHPTAVIESEADPGPEGAQTLKDRVLGITRGNREPLVMPRGTSIKPWQADPQSSKLVEILTQSTNDIAVFFGLPPAMLGGDAGGSLTYTNVESQSLQVLQYAIRYWMTKLERALTRAVAPQALVAKFDEDEFIRVDLRTKFAAITQAVGGPWLSVDEGRHFNDYAPIAGGDVLRSSAVADPTAQPVQEVPQ